MAYLEELTAKANELLQSFACPTTKVETISTQYRVMAPVGESFQGRQAITSSFSVEVPGSRELALLRLIEKIKATEIVEAN